MEYIKKKLEELLTIGSPTGYTGEVSEYLVKELCALGYSPTLTRKGGALCNLGGLDGQDALCLLAHTDTLGGMVSEVKENGRLRITPLGGLMPQNTEGENCTVHTREGRQITGCLQLENASVHVNKDYRTIVRSFENMEVLLDEQASSKKETCALGVETGDIVCFDPRLVITPSGYIKSRFLDDKLSVAILLGFARYLKEENITPRRRLFLHITVFEEVGHGACASVPEGVTELLSVDMGCVGTGLACTEKQVSICVKDSAGPYHYDMTKKLVSLARERGISYAADVYPSYGSDADAALKAGYDVRHGLIGAGVYASHGYERSHVEGVKNTFDLICAYALS